MKTTPVSSRRKIWDLPDFQCPVIGTCLTMGELRKLARKCKSDLESEANDFELHSYFVYKCKDKNQLSQRVQKVLDKKYLRTIRRFAKAKDSGALEALWNEALAEGDIPGPFWAVMSHPYTGAELTNQVFGEVHMLSHLVGSANRNDVRRLKKLERDLDEERTRTGLVKRALRRVSGKLRDERAAARRELLRLRGENAKLLERVMTYEASQPMSRLRELEALNDMLREKSERTEAAAQDVHSELRRLRVETKTLRGRSAQLEHELSIKAEEVASLESAMEQVLASAGCATCDSAATCPKLCGKRILYVGGRTHLVQHYRSLVERSGGEFIHHDGGEECSPCVLGGALSRADYVLFPVDCVSHEACTHIKRLCKNAMKPYLPLRSSGLSSLARGLKEVTV